MPSRDIRELGIHIEILGRDFARPEEESGEHSPIVSLRTADRGKLEEEMRRDVAARLEIEKAIEESRIKAGKRQAEVEEFEKDRVDLEKKRAEEEAKKAQMKTAEKGDETAAKTQRAAAESGVEEEKVERGATKIQAGAAKSWVKGAGDAWKSSKALAGAVKGAGKGAHEKTNIIIDRAMTSKGGSGFVLFALVVFFLDMTLMWFDGLSMDVIMKDPSVVLNLAYNSTLWLVVGFFIIIYVIVYWKRINARELALFALFVMVSTGCILLAGPSGGVVFHIFVGVISWWVIGKKYSDPSQRHFIFAFLILMDFIGMSFFGWIGTQMGNEILIIMGNRLVTPVWFTFAWAYALGDEEKKPLWLNVLIGVVLLLYLGGFIGDSFTYSDLVKELTPEQIRAGESFWRTGLENVLSVSRMTIDNVIHGFVAEGAGPYFGQAEDTKPIGVFLDIEEPEGDVPPRMAFIATVMARFVETEEGYGPITEKLPVTVKCWWGEEDEYDAEHEGTVSPGGTISLSNEEAESFRCKFFERELEPEADRIVFEASASGMEATGELPLFFIDDDLRTQMRNRGEDLFFGEYGGSGSPTIKYTNGPLAIETSALNQPIGIAEEDVLKAFGVKLKNTWEKGEIGRIISLKIDLPKGIDLSDCDVESTLQMSGPRNIYSFDTSAFIHLEDIEDEQWFTCDMTVEFSEKSNLISGPLKAHPRHAYVIAEYDFKVTDSIIITVIGSGEDTNGENGDEGGNGGGGAGLASPLQGVANSPSGPPVDCSSVGDPWLRYDQNYHSSYLGITTTLKNTYEGGVSRIPFNSPGTLKSLTEQYASKYSIDKELLAAIEAEESAMNLVSSCALEHGRSALTGCHWYTSCSKDCKCTEFVSSDGEQIKCTADYFRDAYDEATTAGTWFNDECGEYNGLNLWKCLLCTYLQGSGDLECGGFSEKILSFYCDWKEYYGG